jgi:hypothetical protein
MPFYYRVLQFRKFLPVHFNARSVRCVADVQSVVMILKLPKLFPLNDLFGIFSVHTIFLKWHHIKMSNGVRSVLRGGQRIGPRLPIHLSGNVTNATGITLLKRGGAPSAET